jgi:hypothetical protein
MAFTPEQLEALNEILQKTLAPMVNTAITGHMKRLEKRVDEKFEAQTGAGGGEEQGERPTPQQPAKKRSDEVAELRRMLEEERTSRRLSEAQKQFSEVLTEAGIKPSMQKFVLSHLLHSEKALSFDEAGTPKLTVRRSRSQGSPAEEVEFEDIRAGLHDWLKGEDAKHFLPAPAPRKESTGQKPTTQVDLTGNNHNTGRQLPGASSFEHPQDAIDRVRGALTTAGIEIK